MRPGNLNGNSPKKWIFLRLLSTVGSGRKNNTFIVGFYLHIWLNYSRDKQNAPLRQSKANHKVVYSSVESELLQWFNSRRSDGIIITDVDLKRHALEIGRRMGFDSFKASGHWISDFRKRNGLVYRIPTHTARKSVFTSKDEVSHVLFIIIWDSSLLVLIICCLQIAESEFFDHIEELVHLGQTPPDRVFNMDQTMVRLVSPNTKTISPVGSKQVR